MIQNIRERLGVTRKDLSFYLGLSPHMIKSVEMGRRMVPMDKLPTVASLYEAMKGQERGAFVDPVPANREQLRNVKRLHRKCSRRLERSVARLEKMKESYVNACASLGLCQLLAEPLEPGHSVDDRARLKWLEWKIEEMKLLIQENNAAEQELLTAEIAGLKGLVNSLEGSQLFRSAI